jgi:hypothetical protein
MTPDRLEESLHIIRWTLDTLATSLDCDVSLIEAWLSGEAEIPAKTAAWIGMLASVHHSAESQKPDTHTGKRFTRDNPPGDA